MERQRTNRPQEEIDLDAALAPENLTADGEVTKRTARAIAGVLARYAGLGESSALHRYAVTGRGTNHELRTEYLPLHENPGTPEPIRELIAWLASGTIAEENPVSRRALRTRGTAPALSALLWQTTTGPPGNEIRVHVPADTPPATVRPLRETLTPLIDSLGPPFIAFLTLPDVDATAASLHRSFDEFYIGSYTTREALLREQTELPIWEEEIQALCEAQGIPDGIVTLDLDELWHYAEATWDIVTAPDGTLHQFII